MRLDFEVELPDAPGELSRVLQTIATHGGNVQTVLHRHERAAGGRVPVALTVEIPDGQALRLLDSLARTHRLLRVNRERGPVRSAALLVGHVFEADLRALIDSVFERSAEVERVDARVGGRANPSAVFMTLSAAEEATLQGALSALRSRAEAAHLTMIEEVGGEDLG